MKKKESDKATLLTKRKDGLGQHNPSANINGAQNRWSRVVTTEDQGIRVLVTIQMASKPFSEKIGQNGEQ
ncbi:hypothetical protein AMTR_s00105p00098790 [Amborella trichopoda]|uniref:Uncharacterized protein n=1 Tax=Amborella trichopoda TaxID=13333 RepID=W1NSH3_AMBTC|nr:hypothetical protein AMTR_s00105p00098790 [Amborella trichopoda]